MATLMPSRLAAISQEHSDDEKLLDALRPWRSHLTTQQLLHWTINGVVIGLVLASLVLLASRFVPWAAAPYWAEGATLLCTLVAFVLALWYRPSISRTARVVDRRLALHNRVGTAWELRDETSNLARLQRRDALQQLRKHSPSKDMPLRLGRPTLVIFGLIVVALALLLLLPNPMNAILRQQAAFQNQIAQQVKSIEGIRKQLAQQPGISKAQQQTMDQILRDLETQLKQANNETEAQQALAQAQAKLDQLRNPQASSRAQAAAAAGSA